MSSFTLSLVAVGTLLIFGGLAVGSLFMDSDEQPRAAVLGSSDAGPDLPAESPVAEVQAAIATPTPEPPSPVPATPTRVAPSATPQASDTPAATPTVQLVQANADFTGQWRILDTVTRGFGAGQSFAFDIVLQQAGDQIGGGNDGLLLGGVVNGQTATVNYTQPSTGYTGTFVWTLVSPNLAQGTFTSSYPNSGTSILQRIQ